MSGSEHAHKTAKSVTLPPDEEGSVSVNVVAAPVFLATKLVAWASRGGGDVLHSDIEDIVAVVDGRPELLGELEADAPRLRKFVAESVASLLATGLEDQVAGHLPGDRASQGRLPIVLTTLRRIARRPNLLQIAERVTVRIGGRSWGHRRSAWCAVGLGNSRYREVARLQSAARQLSCCRASAAQEPQHDGWDDWRWARLTRRRLDGTSLSTALQAAPSGASPARNAGVERSDSAEATIRYGLGFRAAGRRERPSIAAPFRAARASVRAAHAMTRDVRDRLGIEQPIVQAGLGGGLARAELATAVSLAGGLGTVGILPDSARISNACSPGAWHGRGARRRDAALRRRVRR